ncbi:MAG: alpha/beta fold hydrolase [Arthrospira sp. PLM2.Bin9]|nr:alpha/beta fold hydrolase [Arthrospira sp. PLM2.Bin9]TVU53722.1 MAG: alpha/beta fold hydrolase [Arthrospira sp. PLM2.Bin9]
MAIATDTIKAGKFDWFYREINREVIDKPPILFLHGLISQSYSWTVIMEEVGEKGYRAIAPDWLGSGYSEKPDKRDFPYTPDAYIQALEEFLNALQLTKFYLVVQGFLGSVGLQYALRHPEKIERLLILNTPVSTEAKLPWKIKQMALPFIGDMMTQDPLLVDRTLEGGSGYVIEDKDLDVYRRPFLKSSSTGRALMATIKNLQLKEAMEEIVSGFPKWDHPIEMIWGTADPWLDLSMAESFVEKTPGAVLVKLDKAGHYPQDHWPQEITESLLLFLRKKAL